MIEVTIIENFLVPIEKVYEIVTNLKDFNWRSDLRNIIVVDENTFEEYPIKGDKTTFKITKKESNVCYEFEIKNKFLTGRWIGLFKKTDIGTSIKFTEQIMVKNFLMRLMAKGYLHKQQNLYIKDLRKRLNEVK